MARAIHRVVALRSQQSNPITTAPGPGTHVRDAVAVSRPIGARCTDAMGSSLRCCRLDARSIYTTLYRRRMWGGSHLGQPNLLDGYRHSAATSIAPTGPQPTHRLGRISRPVRARVRASWGLTAILRICWGLARFPQRYARMRVMRDIFLS